MLFLVTVNAIHAFISKRLRLTPIPIRNIKCYFPKKKKAGNAGLDDTGYFHMMKNHGQTSLLPCLHKIFTIGHHPKPLS